MLSKTFDDATTHSTLMTPPPLQNVTDTGANYTEDQCVVWIDHQHVVLQLGFIAFVISFCVPYHFDHHVLSSRGGMILGSLLVIIWGGVIVCQQDVMAWYVVFGIINFTQCCFWLVTHWPVSLSSDLEDLYNKMFKPLHVTRRQFSEIMAVGQMRDLADGTTYAEEGVTYAGDKLSLLLRGRLKVSCDQLFLHTIEPLQFVDSVEYDRRIVDGEISIQETFQVSIHAIEDCRIHVFESSKLHEFLQENPVFCTVMSTLLGKDITHKLYQVQEMLLAHPHYIRILSTRNSIDQLRHNFNTDNLSPGVSESLNGMLRPRSPARSRVSSIGSRSAISQGHIHVVMTRDCDSMGSTYETCL